jgi:hypothetical protein
MDGRNFPQQILLMDRRIFHRPTVPAREEIRVFAQPALAHDAVNKKPSVAAIEYEITQLHLLKIIRLNREALAGPQCRQHAGSGGPQLQTAVRPQDCGCQLVPTFILGRKIHGAMLRFLVELALLLDVLDFPACQRQRFKHSLVAKLWLRIWFLACSPGGCALLLSRRLLHLSHRNPTCRALSPAACPKPHRITQCTTDQKPIANPSCTSVRCRTLAPLAQRTASSFVQQFIANKPSKTKASLRAWSGVACEKRSGDSLAAE